MPVVIAHLHNNGIRYAVRDNNGAVRCAWHNCTHNVYNSFDDPEREITSEDDNEE